MLVSLEQFWPFFLEFFQTGNRYCSHISLIGVASFKILVVFLSSIKSLKRRYFCHHRICVNLGLIDLDDAKEMEDLTPEGRESDDSREMPEDDMEEETELSPGNELGE